jgi:hypothetical protein
MVILSVMALTKTRNDEQRVREKMAAQERENAEVTQGYRAMVGMNAAQCRRAWGEPKHVIRLSDEAGDYEEWDYGRVWLYLRHGIVTGYSREIGPTP